MPLLLNNSSFQDSGIIEEKIGFFYNPTFRREAYYGTNLQK